MGPPVHRSGAPSPVLTALEGRALGELGALQLAAPLLRRLPKGDGHPVLVLPGFTAGDPSTAPIRSILRRLGYRTYGWHLGRNLGPTPEVIDGLFERLSAAFERDGRPVSLIGWSLGGIYARELARASSDRVRQVITLGSPFRMDSDGRSAVSGLYERLAPRPPTGRRPPAGVRPSDTGGAGNRRLHPNRRCGALVAVPGGGGAPPRKHPGAWQPQWAWPQSGRRDGGRRPPIAARRRVAPVSSAPVGRKLVSATHQLAGAGLTRIPRLLLSGGGHR